MPLLMFFTIDDTSHTCMWPQKTALSVGWCGAHAALEKLIPSPTPRNETWLTSVYPEGSEEPEAAMCSAGYQVTPHCVAKFLGFTFRV